MNRLSIQSLQVAEHIGGRSIFLPDVKLLKVAAEENYKNVAIPAEENSKTTCVPCFQRLTKRNLFPFHKHCQLLQNFWMHSQIARAKVMDVMRCILLRQSALSIC